MRDWKAHSQWHQHEFSVFDPKKVGNFHEPSNDGVKTIFLVEMRLNFETSHRQDTLTTFVK